MNIQFIRSIRGLIRGSVCFCEKHAREGTIIVFYAGPHQNSVISLMDPKLIIVIQVQR